MPLDIEKYRKYVDHYDMTEDQKVAFLETLWSIMESFVDDAWSIESSDKTEPDTQQGSNPIKPIKS